MGFPDEQSRRTEDALRPESREEILMLVNILRDETFLPPPYTDARVRQFVRGGKPRLRTRGMIVSRSMVVCTRYMVRHPRGSNTVYTLLFLEVATPENEQFIRSCHPCVSPPDKRS